MTTTLNDTMRTASLTEAERKRFADLMEQTYKKVYSLAYRLSNSRQDAEDLTQDAYYRAFRSFGEYEGDRPFENWVFRIVTRLYLDLIRSRRRRVQTMSYDAPLRIDGGDDEVGFEVADKSLNAEGLMMSGAFSESLEAALQKLKPENRLLVMLADVEQLPYCDIAEILGVPMGTVRSRLHRAHKLLRAAIAAEESGKNSPSRLCPSGC